MRAIETCASSGRHGASKAVSVPVDNDCGEQIEACHTVVLSLGGSVRDFTLTSDAQSVFQGMMRLAFVKANLGAPLHVRVGSGKNLGVQTGVCLVKARGVFGWTSA